MDHLQSLGLLAIGSRLKRLSDRFMTEGKHVYEGSAVEFEPRWFPLFTFILRQGSASVGEAASAIRISHVAVSRLAKEMAAAGLLVSTKDEHDRRSTCLTITDEGKSRAAALESIWGDIHAACKLIVEQTGFDVMAMLDALDASLDRNGLVSVSKQLVKKRELDTVEIVSYKPSYRKDFSELNREWIERYFVVEEADRPSLNDPQSTIVDDGGDILFAKLNNRIVGTVALVRYSDEIFELAKMAVRQETQGRGIGRKLMNACIDRAKELGAKKLFLVTNGRLTAALHLYRSVGFNDVDLGESSYGRATHRLEMEL